MPTRRAETSQESRRLLLEAAAGAFAEKGYRQTTVADVADIAGISRGSIPWHFGSKEGLLLAVVEHTFLSTSRTFTDDLEAGPPGLDRLADRVEAFTRQPASKLLISLLLEALEPDSPIHDRYAELHAAVRRSISAWAARPHSAVALPEGTTPDDLGMLVLAATIGIHQQWRMAPDHIDLHAAYSALRRVVLAALRPER